MKSLITFALLFFSFISYSQSNILVLGQNWFDLRYNNDYEKLMCGCIKKPGSETKISPEMDTIADPLYLDNREQFSDAEYKELLFKVRSHFFESKRYGDMRSSFNLYYKFIMTQVKKFKNYEDAVKTLGTTLSLDKVKKR